MEIFALLFTVEFMWLIWLNHISSLKACHIPPGTLPFIRCLKDESNFQTRCHQVLLLNIGTKITAVCCCQHRDWNRIGECSSVHYLVHVQYRGEMLNAGHICSNRVQQQLFCMSSMKKMMKQENWSHFWCRLHSVLSPAFRVMSKLLLLFMPSSCPSPCRFPITHKNYVQYSRCFMYS